MGPIRRWRRHEAHRRKPLSTVRAARRPVRRASPERSPGEDQPPSSFVARCRTSPASAEASTLCQPIAPMSCARCIRMTSASASEGSRRRIRDRSIITSGGARARDRRTEPLPWPPPLQWRRDPAAAQRRRCSDMSRNGRALVFCRRRRIFPHASRRMPRRYVRTPAPISNRPDPDRAGVIQ